MHAKLFPRTKTLRIFERYFIISDNCRHKNNFVTIHDTVAEHTEKNVN